MEAAGHLSTRRSTLVTVLVANAAFMVVEVVAGLAFSSLALLADAAHMLSDVAALTIALVALQLSQRPPSQRHSFGLRRAEVLGAQANALLLLVTAGWIGVEAVERLTAPEPVQVEGVGLVAVATLGLVVNLASAWALARTAGTSLNLRGAYLHMVSDALGSVGALLAGLAVLGFGADRADPLISLAITALVLWSGWRLLRGAVHVLLEGAPPGLDALEVNGALLAEAGVEAVHHLHLWSVASDEPALSAHVVLSGPLTLHDAQARGDELKMFLAERFGIHHSTLELECHTCDPAGAALFEP